MCVSTPRNHQQSDTSKSFHKTVFIDFDHKLKIEISTELQAKPDPQVSLTQFLFLANVAATAAACSRSFVPSAAFSLSLYGAAAPPLSRQAATSTALNMQDCVALCREAHTRRQRAWQ